MGRPSVQIQSQLIEKFLGSDFDQVATVEERVAAIEAIIASIDNLEVVLEAANDITNLLTNINSLYVAAPLLDNAVDFSAEGFAEDTLGSFLAAIALIVKVNETAVSNNVSNISSAATAVGTSYPPLGGNWDASLTNVKLVLDSLRGFFTRSGTIVHADNATQSSAYAYTTGTTDDLPNDGLGSSTDDTYAPTDIEEFYDSSSDQFELSDFKVGDVLTLRVDLDVVTTAANQVINIFLATAEGTAQEKEVVISRQVFAAAADNPNVVGEITFVIDHADILSNPGHVRFSSDADASVRVNSFTLFANVKD